MNVKNSENKENPSELPNMGGLGRRMLVELSNIGYLISAFNGYANYEWSNMLQVSQSLALTVFSSSHYI